MTTWLRIAGSPARQFYRDASALSFLNIREARHALLVSLGTLSSASTGETPNATATLSNVDGSCSRLFATQPPIGVPAEIHDENGVLFAGTVTRLTLDAAQCAVEISA